MTADATRGLTVRDVVVLSLLAEGPTYGYAIEAELQRRDVRDWADISRPQVYKSLEKLRRLKFATRAAKNGPPRGPESATIRITRAGSEALEARLEDSDWSTDRSRPLFLTWLALCSTLSTPKILVGIRSRENYLRVQVERERQTLVDIERDDTIATVFPSAMVRLTILSFEIELTWLRDLCAGVSSRSRS